MLESFNKGKKHRQSVKDISVGFNEVVAAQKAEKKGYYDKVKIQIGVAISSSLIITFYIFVLLFFMNDNDNDKDVIDTMYCFVEYGSI